MQNLKTSRHFSQYDKLMRISPVTMVMSMVEKLEYQLKDSSASWVRTSRYLKYQGKITKVITCSNKDLTTKTINRTNRNLSKMQDAHKW